MDQGEVRRLARGEPRSVGVVSEDLVVRSRHRGKQPTLVVGDLDAAVRFPVTLDVTLRYSCVLDGVLDGKELSSDRIFLNSGAESHLEIIMGHCRLPRLLAVCSARQREDARRRSFARSPRRGQH